MELLSWGSRNPCYCEFWCPGKLSQSLYFVKRVFYRFSIHVTRLDTAHIRKAKAIFSSLLSCLCLADIAFLTSSLFLVPVALGCTGTTFFTLYSIFDCFSHVSLSGSVFFTVAITIERYKVSSALPKSEHFKILFFKGSLFGSQIQLP